MPALVTAGPIFHASDLAGAVSQQVPITSYAFAPTNPNFFGIDATYSASGIVSLYTTITPFLQPPGSVASIYCTPFLANAPQSVKCNVFDRSIGPGEWTISFEQCPPTMNQACQTTYVDGAVTFSVVPAPFTTVTPAVTTISVTLTSGTTDTTTTTTIFPASTATVTSYESTVTSVQTSTTSLTGARAPVTVTGTCPAVTTTTAKASSCNHDNCLRALLGKTSSASAFCATFTTGSGHKVVPSAFASPCSSVSSRLTSACSCLSTSNSVSKPRRRQQQGRADLDVGSEVETREEALDVGAASEEERRDMERRGLVVLYGPPDYTFGPGQYSAGTVTADVTTTVTVATVPSTTTTDPGAITTSGTSTSVVEVTTTTVTVVVSTVDSRTASTVTVPPANCGSSTVT